MFVCVCVCVGGGGGEGDEEAQVFTTVHTESHTQLAFYVNLYRAVIGPSATLTGR